MQKKCISDLTWGHHQNANFLQTDLTWGRQDCKCKFHANFLQFNFLSDLTKGNLLTEVDCNFLSDLHQGHTKNVRPASRSHKKQHLWPSQGRFCIIFAIDLHQGLNFAKKMLTLKMYIFFAVWVTLRSHFIFARGISKNNNSLVCRASW